MIEDREAETVRCEFCGVEIETINTRAEVEARWGEGQFIPVCLVCYEELKRIAAERAALEDEDEHAQR